MTLLHQLFSLMGIRAGLISTVENIIGTEVIPSTHTTPDPVSLNELLAKMADGGCDYVFMEVSSHAAHQQRISGLRLKVAYLPICLMIILIITTLLMNILQPKSHFLMVLEERALLWLI